MKYIGFVLIAFVLSTCITPINLDPDEPDPILVIDGFITDQEGVFEVIISRLSRFASIANGGQERFDKESEVFITDQNGNRTDLKVIPLTRNEVTNPCAQNGGCCPTGTILQVESLGFRTDGTFKAELGNTYTLNVITFNGFRYQSTPQTIIPGSEIDSISYRYKELPSSDPVSFESGVELFSHWQDPVETANFYSWRVNGIYKIDTPPKQGVCCMLDPNDVNAQTTCWINEDNMRGNELAFNDLQSNGSTISKRVGFVQDDGLRFGNSTGDPNRQYYAEVEQWALSQEAFAFFSLLKSQIEIDGDIFDPPPAEITGNIRNLDRPDEIVIGFFGAYSVKKKGVFIKRSDIKNIQFNPRPCGDCRNRAGAQVPIPEVFR